MKEELAPFIRSGRIKIEGPDVSLNPSTTQDIALVLHELATNAAKYGALSVPSGTLSVRWRYTEHAVDPNLDLIWQESGGPAVRVPERFGFGSALVEATLTSQMKGSAHFHWRADGLCVELSIPVATTKSHALNTDVATTISPVSQPLSGRSILLIEDEPLIGLHAQNCLENVGCNVVGPIARMEPAMVAARDAAFDFAILDINLAGQMTFPVADVLAERGIPFAFCSGYSSASDIPDRFADIPVLRKPLGEAELLAAASIGPSQI